MAGQTGARGESGWTHGKAFRGGTGPPEAGAFAQLCSSEDGTSLRMKNVSAKVLTVRAIGEGETSIDLDTSSPSSLGDQLAAALPATGGCARSWINNFN